MMNQSDEYPVTNTIIASLRSRHLCALRYSPLLFSQEYFLIKVQMAQINQKSRLFKNTTCQASNANQTELPPFVPRCIVLHVQTVRFVSSKRIYWTCLYSTRCQPHKLGVGKHPFRSQSSPIQGQVSPILETPHPSPV